MFRTLVAFAVLAQSTALVGPRPTARIFGKPAGVCLGQSCRAPVSLPRGKVPLTATTQPVFDGSDKPKAAVPAPPAAAPASQTKERLVRIMYVLAGCLPTWYMNNPMGMGNVISCGLVVLSGALALPAKWATVMACGSFSGQSGFPVTPTLPQAIILSVVTAFMIELFDKKKWLVGAGGRLGWIAMCSCSVNVFFRDTLPRIFKSFVPAAFTAEAAAPVAAAAAAAETAKVTPAFFKLGLYKTLTTKAYCKAMLGPLVASSMFGTFFMRMWRTIFHKIPRLGSPPAAVGVTGIAVHFLLPPQWSGPALAGAFLGMSSEKYFPGIGVSPQILFAAALGGMFQLAISGIIVGGWGGKLGTASLFGVLTYGAMRGLPVLTRKMKTL